jgi:hypothetical protein
MQNNENFHNLMKNVLENKNIELNRPPLPPNPHPSSSSSSPIQPQQPFNQNKLNIFQKYEISKNMSLRLEILNSFKIVFVFDDSSSMTKIDLNLSVRTRWDELLKFASISIELANLYNQEDGCDIYFFNREPVRKTKTKKQLDDIFSTEPMGTTTMLETLKRIYNDHLNNNNNKKLLILIATDGEPTDYSGQSKIDEFKQFLINRPNNVYTSIVACTDDLDSIGYLNNLDNKLPRFDVVRDYKNEMKEIRNKQGVQFQFSYGDYITKTLIGSIDDELGKLDF